MPFSLKSSTTDVLGEVDEEELLDEELQQELVIEPLNYADGEGRDQDRELEEEEEEEDGELGEEEEEEDEEVVKNDEKNMIETLCTQSLQNN